MTVATLAGVPIRLHWSFVLLVVVWVGWSARMGGLSQVPLAVGVVVLLFGSVLAHELGHAMAARRMKIRTHEIVLLPIGGAARMELRFVSPYADLLVSVAGPATSLALGLACLAVWQLSGSSVLMVLGAANVVLGLFNLIPAFPMDGGRVLRALLTELFGMQRAAAISLVVGAGFALLFVLAGGMLNELGLVAVGAMLLAMQVQEVRVLRALGRATR